MRLVRVLLLLVLLASPALAEGLPKGFVYVSDAVPGVELDIRYFGSHNFLGQRVAGYEAPTAILTVQAATALAGVQADLKPFGLGLKVYDGYRPQRAVDHFVSWAQDLGDTRMKSEFYPKVNKADLIPEGYIADRSSHTRGSTVDLTIMDLATGKDIDMGSNFDYFGPQSWPLNQSMTADQRANRMLLQTLMVKHGFKPYDQEWWHFTLADEPFPKTYFDFPVQ